MKPPVAALLILTSQLLHAEARVEPNVIYGMYSGLALLMDVHHPAKPNGYGILFIPGSGWQAPLAYGARPLKDSDQVPLYGKPLLAAGYTVFAISHRATPRFQYPGAVEDVQRAVRFVRHHAARYGIDPQRIGGVGGSSGGHLISLLGTLDGKGDPEDPDPVNRQSAKLACVVARAAPADLLVMQGARGSPNVASFMGMLATPGAPPGTIEHKTYREASPVNHATPDDPPFLLMHGDADNTVPFEQSERLERALAKAGVPVKLLRIPGGGHGPSFDGAKDPPDYIGEMIRWLDQHLRKR